MKKINICLGLLSPGLLSCLLFEYGKKKHATTICIIGCPIISFTSNHFHHAYEKKTVLFIKYGKKDIFFLKEKHKTMCIIDSAW